MTVTSSFAIARSPIAEPSSLRTEHGGRFRAKPLGKELSKKRINNILAVLSKALRYADDVGLIKAPRKVGLFKVEGPEIEAWELDQYARILAAAKQEGIDAAVCLAGEAGLRVGEIKALRGREDVDMVAKTITVNQQMRRGAQLRNPRRNVRREPVDPAVRVESGRALKAIPTIGASQC